MQASRAYEPHPQGSVERLLRQIVLGTSGRRSSAASVPWTKTRFDVLREVGTACMNAPDARCRERVAHRPESSTQCHCDGRCTEWSVVTTRGDEVKRWGAPDEIAALLGSVDSYDDALMVVASYGYDVSCRQERSKFGADASPERSVRAVPGGYEVVASRVVGRCPLIARRARLSVSSEGELRVLEAVDVDRHSCIGRVPAGLQSASIAQGESVLGDHLAHCAHLESASVHAFERLAEELALHGAPDVLSQRALAAAEDEVRHARLIGALARRHHGLPSEPEVCPPGRRTLEQIALENGVEGCVYETYGALVGAYQAERAREPTLRRIMRNIASDEARHAALSHDVHRFLMRGLDAAARTRVREACGRAIARLGRSSAEEPSEPLRMLAGLPSSSEAQDMLAQLTETLWSRAELAS